MMMRPWPLSLNISSENKYYQSNFLEALAVERDRRNGVPFRDLAERFPGEIWRQDIDPCEARASQMSVHNSQAHDEAWKQAMSARDRLKLDEASRSGIRCNTEVTSTSFNRVRVFEDVVSENTAGFGFSLDLKRSRQNQPVFSKSLADEWDLCLSVENLSGFLGTFRREGQEFGCVDVVTSIRHSKLTGSIRNANPRKLLILRLQEATPYFSVAYREFFDASSLGLSIRANLALLRTVSKILDEEVAAVLH